MKTHPQKSMFRSIRRTGWRVVRWTAIDAITGTVGGSLFGTVFGGFGILIHHDPSQIVPGSAYFAVCGTVAGAVVGMYAAIVDAEETSESEYSPPHFARSVRVPDESVRKIAIPSEYQPRNRLIGAFDAEWRRREALASQDPSQS